VFFATPVRDEAKTKTCCTDALQSTETQGSVSSESPSVLRFFNTLFRENALQGQACEFIKQSDIREFRSFFFGGVPAIRPVPGFTLQCPAGIYTAIPRPGPP
jgi:hypothetical protein